jgi:hypothetical protein
MDKATKHHTSGETGDRQDQIDVCANMRSLPEMDGSEESRPRWMAMVFRGQYQLIPFNPTGREFHPWDEVSCGEFFSPLCEEFQS